MKSKILVIILIAILCVMPIFFVIYAKFLNNKPNESVVPDNTVSQIEKEDFNEEDLINNFDNLFSNKINYQKNNISNINKKDNTKELVYTSYELSEEIQNKYSINAKIPTININHSNANKINAEIENIFKNKIGDIIAQSSDSNIQLYDVEYVSYVNSNILSLVIKATLKSGNSAQRVLVKTYNYNLSSNEEISLEQVLSSKGISKSFANKKIQDTVKKADTASQSLKDLGYTVYTRDLNSGIYKIENTTTFFIGKDSILYVIYPYGNSNMTSEIDLIVFK